MQCGTVRSGISTTGTDIYHRIRQTPYPTRRGKVQDLGNLTSSTIQMSWEIEIPPGEEEAILYRPSSISIAVEVPSMPTPLTALLSEPTNELKNGRMDDREHLRYRERNISTPILQYLA